MEDNHVKAVTFGGKIHECLKEYDKGNVDQFNIIIVQLTDTNIDYRKLNKLIVQIISCAPLVTKNHNKLVHTLLNMDWREFPEVLLQNWVSCILAITISQPIHLRLCMCTLALTLKAFVNIEPGMDFSEEEIEELNKKQFIQFKTAHLMIRGLLERIPLAKIALVEVLEEKLPSRFGQVEEHFQYIKNVLVIAEQFPTLRQQLMHIVFKHLGNIDHMLPKTFLLEVVNQGDDDEEKVELNVTQLQLMSSLDKMCCLFIDFIDKVINSDDKSESAKKLQILLRDFMPCFEKSFLPQPTTKSVQFILFYLLSLKTSFPDSFIDWLLKRVTSPSEPVLKRQAAASYLCGLCARADYVLKTTVIEVINILSQFCMKYLLSIPENKQTIDQVKFLPFYFVAQSLFYIIIFRIDWLPLSFMRKLNLQTIVFSKLNPLYQMVPSIALKFCDIMKEKEIFFGHVILEQTRKERLAIRGIKDDINPIDFYFPFDQCLLTNLAEKIDPFYNYWKQDEDSSDSELE